MKLLHHHGCAWRYPLPDRGTRLLGMPTRHYLGNEYLYPRDVGSSERTISLGLRFRL